MRSVVTGAMMLGLAAMLLPASASAQPQKEPREVWGGKLYDPRTKTTTSVQMNPDGTRVVTVRDHDGQAISHRTHEGPEPLRAEWYDPDTKQVMTATKDPASGGFRVTAMDREGNVLSDRVEHQTIGTDQALERLLFYRDDLIGLWETRLYDRYVRHREQTLREAFQQAGVQGEAAMSYAESWDPTLHAWLDSAGRFYDAHFDAVNRSISAVKQRPSVYTGDLAYLAQGMDRWWDTHRQIQDLMERMVETLAQKAKALDEAHDAGRRKSQVWDRFQQQGTAALAAGKDAELSRIHRQRDEAVKPLEEEEQAHQQRAKDLDKDLKAIRRQIDALSPTRAFSPLGAKNPIPVAEAPRSERGAALAKDLIQDLEAGAAEVAEAQAPEAPAEPPDQRLFQPAELAAGAEAEVERQARLRKEALEQEVSEAARALEDAEAAYRETFVNHQRLAYAEDTLRQLEELRFYSPYLVDWEKAKDRGLTLEQFSKYRKHYGDVAEQLKGLDDKELEQAFRSSLEEAVNARWGLFHKPNTPPRWSWEPRSDIGDVERQALEEQHNRQVAKMNLISRRLGLNANDVQNTFTGVSRELNASYSELVRTGEAAYAAEEQVNALRKQLGQLEASLPASRP